MSYERLTSIDGGEICQTGNFHVGLHLRLRSLTELPIAQPERRAVHHLQNETCWAVNDYYSTEVSKNNSMVFERYGTVKIHRIIRLPECQTAITRPAALYFLLRTRHAEPFVKRNFQEEKNFCGVMVLYQRRWRDCDALILSQRHH